MSFKINNKRHLAVIVSCSIIICNFYACKKNNSSPGVKHVITYKLTGSIYTPFNNISYTDSVGIQQSASAADSTIGWSKIVSEPYSNFPVLLEVVGQNSSSSQLTFTLEIIVDGTTKAKQQYSTAAFNSFDNQVSALIQ